MDHWAMLEELEHWAMLLMCSVRPGFCDKLHEYCIREKLVSSLNNQNALVQVRTSLLSPNVKLRGYK